MFNKVQGTYNFENFFMASNCVNYNALSPEKLRIKKKKIDKITTLTCF